MKQILFALFLLASLPVFGQTKSLGLQIVFIWQGDTMDTRYLEPYLIARGYDETRAWATKATFLEKCRKEGEQTALEVFDAMIYDRCGKGLTDYYQFFKELSK